MNLQPTSLPPVPDLVAMCYNTLEKDALDRTISRLRTMEAVAIDMPPKFTALMTPARYKVFYGGRGGAKSWSIARALVKLAAEKPLRILCTREFQSSIGDSVYRLICDQIISTGLSSIFDITQASITSAAGAQFLFKGLRRSIQEIKSMEGIDICWVEEAQTISNAVIFRGRFEIGDFDEPPPGTRLYYGADWGFSQDPTTLVRCWIDGDCLKVDQEAYEVGVELDNLPQLFSGVPGAQEWPILADSSRPETISHVRRKGFQVSAAPKWPRKIPGSGRTSTDVSMDGVFLTASVKIECEASFPYCCLFCFPNSPNVSIGSN